MSGLQGYDQWKTASPYDGIDDSYCQQCGIKLPDLDKDYIYDGFCSRACEKDDKKYHKPWPLIRPMLNLLCRELGINLKNQRPDSIIDIINHIIYKNTDCGAGIDLIDNYTIEIGSIIEGTDVVTEKIELIWPFSKKDFWNALDNTEKEAKYIWDQTHGCPDCDIEGEWGDMAINPNCKKCKGEGIIL